MNQPVNINNFGFVPEAISLSSNKGMTLLHIPSLTELGIVVVVVVVKPVNWIIYFFTLPFWPVIR